MALATILGYVVSINRLLQSGVLQPRKAVHMTSGLTWILVWIFGNIPLLCTLVGLSFAQFMQARFPPWLLHAFVQCPFFHVLRTSLGPCCERTTASCPASAWHAQCKPEHEAGDRIKYSRGSQFCVVLCLLTLTDAVQAWQNMTTNEMQNWPRYKHFKRKSDDPRQPTAFHNPFDKGPCRNCHELCFPAQHPMLPSYLEPASMGQLRQAVHASRTR
jgi:hypothetical protein